MRLIDAHALRARYQLCLDALPDEAKRAKSQLAYCLDMLDNTQTVRCDACTHQMNGAFFDACRAEITMIFEEHTSPLPPNFGCSYFERKET